MALRDAHALPNVHNVVTYIPNRHSRGASAQSTRPSCILLLNGAHIQPKEHTALVHLPVKISFYVSSCWQVFHQRLLRLAIFGLIQSRHTLAKPITSPAHHASQRPRCLLSVERPLTLSTPRGPAYTVADRWLTATLHMSKSPPLPPCARACPAHPVFTRCPAPSTHTNGLKTHGLRPLTAPSRSASG